jgi:hypothetical protein
MPIGFLDTLVTNPATDAGTMLSIADAFRQLGNIQKMEEPLLRYAPMMSNSAEAWYESFGNPGRPGKRPSLAASNVARAFAISDRRITTNSLVRNLREKYRTDPRFERVRKSPEFKQYN